MFQLRCWLNLLSPSSAVSIVPALLLSVSSFVVLLFTMFCSHESGRRPLSASVYSRAKTLRRTRYLLFIILILLSLSWGVGVVSAHYQHSTLALIFLVLRAFLAMAILLRCFLDSQVMGRIKRGYLKCEAVREVYEADEAVLSRKTTYASQASETPPETEYVP